MYSVVNSTTKGSCSKPDLTALWGYLKAKVFATRPQNIQELKVPIAEEVQRIDRFMLQRVMNHFLSDLEKCTEVDGGHLNDVIFKSEDKSYVTVHCN